MYPEYGGDEYDAGFKVGYDTARDKYEAELTAANRKIAELEGLLREKTRTKAILDTGRNLMAQSHAEDVVRLQKRLKDAEGLLKGIVDAHYAAGMCDRTADIYPDLGSKISRMIPGIKAFLLPSPPREPDQPEKG